MGVSSLLVDVGLIDVVGPDGIEGGDVAGHAGHEAGEERGEAEAQDSSGEEMEEHDGNSEVVVIDGRAVGVHYGFAAERIGFDRDDAVGVGFVEGERSGGGGWDVEMQVLRLRALRSTQDDTFFFWLHVLRFVQGDTFFFSCTGDL